MSDGDPLLYFAHEEQQEPLARSVAAFLLRGSAAPSKRRPSMKLKLWLRNLSVSGPHVAVRTRLPWTVRTALSLIVLGLAAAGLVLVYHYARNSSFPGADELVSELQQTRDQLSQMTAERDRLAAQAVQAENQLKVERATQLQIAAQMRSLEEDNARLKGDLAFFESLLPAQGAQRGVVIRSFKLQPDTDDGHMRYRLLVQQSGRPDRDFVGSIGLRVTLQKDGSSSMIQLPDPAIADAGPTPLAFRHYQRVEGTFALPSGATVRSVQVTITSGGETRAQQTFAM